MKSGKRTDQSVAGVFTDLSDLLEEGTTSPMRKISVPPPPGAEKDFARIVPTSLMVDTQPNEFEPVSPDRVPSLAQQGPDESKEVAELLGAPSSRTIRFHSEQNPAAAFAPSVGTPVAVPEPVEATHPLQPVRARSPHTDSIGDVRSSTPSFHDTRPSLAPVHVVKRSFSPGALVVAIVVSSIVAIVVTAFGGSMLVKACRQSPNGRLCAIAP